MTVTGVLPCIDGTWQAICPVCNETVIWLEQSYEKVGEALAVHLEQHLVEQHLVEAK